MDVDTEQRAPLFPAHQGRLTDAHLAALGEFFIRSQRVTVAAQYSRTYVDTPAGGEHLVNMLLELREQIDGMVGQPTE